MEKKKKESKKRRKCHSRNKIANTAENWFAHCFLTPASMQSCLDLRTVIFKSPFRLRKQRGMVDGNSSYTQDANISI